MKKTADAAPFIAPVDADTKRPLWSVMIPTYNCATYLRETLESVLIQDLGPEIMQIEVIDDFSTKDDPESVVAEIGKGRVAFFRQEKNVGSLKNFETCINRSKGILVHQLHGDDKVLPGFYKKMKSVFDRYPTIGAAFCRHASIDAEGNFLSNSRFDEKRGVLNNWLEKIAIRNWVQTPAVVVKREVYEKLGAFRSVHYGEDWEMWARIAAHYPVAYESEVLAHYRKHNSSITGQYMRTAQNMRDVQVVIDIINEYLPEEKRKEIKELSLKYHALQAFNNAKHLKVAYNDQKGAKAQIKEAFKMHKQPEFLFLLLKHYCKLKLG